MWESSRKRSRHSQWLVPVLLGVVIALAQLSIVSRAWADCGINGATGLTTGSLYALGMPALTFLNAVLLALPAEVWMSKRGSRPRRVALTVLSFAVLVAAETVLLAHFVATPAEPVGTICAGNVPGWWPEWMPT